MYPGNGEERGGEQIALHLFPVEELERQAAEIGNARSDSLRVQM